MSGNQKTHPERSRLVDFGLGKLDPEEALAVESHVAECEACSATLFDLQADTFVDLVRRSDAVQLEPDKEATVDGPRTMTASAKPGEVESDLPPELAHHPRYRIIERLGSGGMGAVYKAEHKLMNRLVALKLIRHELVKHPQAVQRFRHEVQAAAQLSHPNIVTAYDAEQAGDMHFLVMEYVDGTDLAEMVSWRGRLPVAEACRYIRQAAEGLQAAHALQMVHRDIKPQNLMVTPDGQVKILDFGLAGFVSEAAVVASKEEQCEQPLRASSARLTSVGSTMGTPDYISPEQARDARTADIRSDIYSLGCTLYYLLSGQPLFPQGSVLEKVKAHLEKQPRPLSELRDDLPGGLEAVLGRMLAKDPPERFQTPTEVAQALAPFAEPSTAPYRSWWRRAGTLVATALAALFICAATIFYVQLGRTTIKFEIEDPTLAVRFDGDTITVDNQGQIIHVKPGEDHEFIVEQNGLEAETDSFTLKKGQKIVLRVTLVEGQVAVIPSRSGVPIKRPAAEPQADEPKARIDLSQTKPPIQEVRRFEGGHARRIDCVAVSADGRWLLSGSADATVRLWDVVTGEEIRPLLGHTTGVNCVAFSPDGRHALSGGIDAVRLWDVETGKEIRVFEEARVAGVAFSPDGRLALSGKAAYGVHKGDVTLRLWDVQSGRQLRSLAGENDIVWSVAFSPDGRRALAGGAGFSGPNRIGLWDTETGELVRHFMGGATTVTSVAFSPDGRRVVSGHSGFVIEDGKCVLDPRRGLVRLWDVETGREIRRFKGHSGPVNSVAFSPDGWYVLSGSGGQHDSYGKFVETDDNTIRLWDAESGRELWRADLDQRVAGVAFLPDGRHVVSAGGDYDGGPDLRLWQLPKSVWPVKQLTEIRRFEGHTRMINSVAASPDGRFLLSGDEGGGVLLSNLETGKAEKGFARHEGSVYDLSFSPDGTAYSCSFDQTARRWDVQSGQEIRRYEGHTGWVRALAVSPDGKHLLTGSTWFGRTKDQQGIPPDNSLRLWDVETGQEVRRFEDVAVGIRDVAFAPDGKTIVAGGQNSMLGLWDVETGKRIRRFLAPTTVLSVAFSPDGTQVASSHLGGLKDGKYFDPEHSVIILWDVKTGEEIRRLRGHTARINSIAFSRDGRFIASVAGGGHNYTGWHDAQENTVRIWDVATGEELDRAEAGITLNSVAFTPDGRYLVTGGGRSGDPGPADLRLWKLPQSVWPKYATDVSPKPDNATRPSLDETVSPEPSLGIGSPAPPLSVAQWISGESIDGFTPGQVYVVEFWATWCPPCRTSMPHLSQLQQQYGDEVKFVGVTREPEETVKEFLAKEQSPGKTWAEVVQYRLAIDSEAATHQAYMKAAGQSGIPTAFIVGRDAAVEWIGHPMSMEEPLGKIVAGDWDRQAAIAHFQQQQKLMRLSREIFPKLWAEEWDDALEMLDQLEKESGKSYQLSQMRWLALQKAGRSEEASKLQAEMVEQAWDSPTTLISIAWYIARSKGEGDLDLAFKAAQRASELKNHKDAAILDTLARVYYEKGQLDNAIQWQKKAVEHNQGNRSIDATLKKYEAEKALQPGDSSAPAK